MGKSKKGRSSRTSSKNLQQYANLAGIGSFLISIVTLFILLGPSMLGLTTINNPSSNPDPAGTGYVMTESSQFYTEAQFADATVAGTLFFIAAITENSEYVDSAIVRIYPESDPNFENNPLSSFSLSLGNLDSMTEMALLALVPGADAFWSSSFDTTSLENGVYWFELVIIVADGGGGGGSYDIPLSVFGLDHSGATDEGQDSSGAGRNDEEQTVFNPWAIVVFIALPAIIAMAVWYLFRR